RHAVRALAAAIQHDVAAGLTRGLTRGLAAKVLQSEALLVRAVPYGESDIVATFMCADGGKVAAMARSARKSSKRFGGALEPFHTIAVTLQDRGRELTVLTEARIVRVRTGIATKLESVDAAGSALRWTRDLCPPRTEEQGAWAALIDLLDALDHGKNEPKIALAFFAMRLLSEVGYALELDRCLVCGKPCPADKPARIDPARGGIVCLSCGGARLQIGARLRQAARDMQRGVRVEISTEEATDILKLAELAMAAHADVGA
ncbi:MAG: DNA repair protein RecO, partial [Polyangiaceae bacterium]